MCGINVLKCFKMTESKVCGHHEPCMPITNLVWHIMGRRQLNLHLPTFMFLLAAPSAGQNTSFSHMMPKFKVKTVTACNLITSSGLFEFLQYSLLRLTHPFVSRQSRDRGDKVTMSLGTRGLMFVIIPGQQKGSPAVPGFERLRGDGLHQKRKETLQA